MSETDKFIAEFKRWNAEYNARVEAQVQRDLRARMRKDWMLIVLSSIVPFCIAVVVGLLIYLMPEAK